ncbi:armadillo-type protein [Mycena olivaceomarginata]|nr:armadillo-type protein [Mycena olivaceomarginata]
MWSCRIVGNLARFQSRVPALRHESRCKTLVQLLRDEAPAVAESAVLALSRIAYGVKGAVTVVEAGALQFLDDLVQSADIQMRVSTCLMLRNIARHESTSAAVLAANPCSKLVRLLRAEPPVVIAAAAHALSEICRSAAGAQAAIEAGTLGLLDTLLAHPHDVVRRYTSEFLAHLRILSLLSPNSANGQRPPPQLHTQTS